MINKLYLCSQNYNFDIPNVRLVNKKIISSAENIDCYTSIEDIIIENLSTFVSCAKSITLCDLNINSNFDIIEKLKTNKKQSNIKNLN